MLNPTQILSIIKILILPKNKRDIQLNSGLDIWEDGQAVNNNKSISQRFGSQILEWNNLWKKRREVGPQDTRKM